jgi:3-oxoacyl-[acyl-carrier-protein] synthase-3
MDHDDRSIMCVDAGGGYENVLVVGADALSRYVDWMDRGTCIKNTQSP